ncbi:right-handed parallel beta-helix repeat-containing protein [Streptomyces bathyalis]|uniref:Right-handed parallel beta-helix repeat-containing protein n=1 Tax=Streptomyces bathyalis TaxID=2710756 RepID=A0A7T1T7X0_9ACTN|nr:right-handed parallel beta-helix repeat-containing protein [Streptomyces bathyalis]QPP08027.1 right-handed parallel beta-helix repeat-containing protein [Streptomyces bathyalis]
MKIILRSGAATAAIGVGLSLAVLPAVPAGAAAAIRVPCNDITALKNAINRANASANAGRIVLASHCTYSLTAPDNADDGLPEITGDVTITGRDTTIRRAPSATQDFRIFHVVSGGTLTLNSITVSGGRLSLADTMGGGIANTNGTLNLNRSIIRGNEASQGGGVHNFGGRLNLDRTTVERNTNTTVGATAGGGVFNTDSGTMKMRGGSLINNRSPIGNGGGLENIRQATAHLNSVSVRGNTALLGGGIRQTQRGVLRLTSSTVSNNVAVSGAGLSNLDSTATLMRSLVTRNTAINNGGGIDNPPPSRVTLIDSKVIRNTPDNCSPAGSVPGCTNPDPANAVTLPAPQLPAPATESKSRR